MYVKLYEQSSNVWSRVHNANHIGQAGYIKDDKAIGYVPVYRRITNSLKFSVKDGRDDISTDAYGKHGQYTGVTPSHGNIYK